MSEETVKRGRGRPKGRRNKVNPKQEISRAFKAGKSLTDIVEFLSDRLDSKDVTDTQKSKFVDLLVKIKMELLTKSIKEESKSVVRVVESSEKPTTSDKKTDDNVAVFKLNSG